MQRKVFFIVAVLVAFTVLGFVHTVYADSPTPAAAQNQVVVDITVNSAGEMTVGGVSLKALNVAPLNSTTTEMIKNLDNGHLVVQGDVVTLDLHGTPIMKMQWDASSRQAVVGLAAKYGYTVGPDVLSRIEEWITSSSLDVTARYTNEPSKPLVIKLTKPVLVDIGPQGQVAVEKGPLAYGLDQSVMQPITQSGAKDALICWNKGTLTAKVDGKALPSITLDPKGAQYLVKALNLQITNIDPFFNAQLGVDIALPGGAHLTGATCGQ
ncbi:MAG: hypothetical protein M1132_07500 [Chloroflexi bacterium]|nr:hypothetical protein [Chloroflexota bacterium]